MKKILILSNKDNVIYNFRAELMIALKNAGYDVVFVCPYGKKLDFLLEKGFRNIDIQIDRRGKSIFKDLLLIKNYKKIFKDEKPDLVLTYTSKPSIYGGYVCKKQKIPYIVNNAGLMHASGLFETLMKRLYIVGYKKASCLMFQNDEEKEYILSLFKNKPYYRSIPGSGVNLDNFKFVEYPKDSNVIIFNFVARIVGFKGIDEYLGCAKYIHTKYPNTIFRIFGDFDDDKYRAILDEYSKAGFVEYKGVVMDMKPWIANCHAAIHPSYYEGMTNVVLEHSATGRPCLGSNISGVKEGIDDGKTGFIFEVKNTSSLINAVEKFLALSYVEKRQMGINARKKMENEFDRHIITNIYLEEVERIIGK